MVLTPQLIKDQEFQVKFRGCDPIEVRDYLDIIANEFFELQEQCKEYSDELEALRKVEESSENYKSSLETDMEFTRKMSDELKDGCAKKEERIKELVKEVEELQLRIADMEQEDVEHDEEISTAEALIKEAETALKEAVTEKESLQNKMEILQQQNEDLKKDEVDFKSTLAAAQQFAEDLKEKSRVQAEEMIAEANAEINKIIEDARDELERLPREIDALKNKKAEVKADLKATLESYLETIDVFYPDEENDKGPVDSGVTKTEEAEGADEDEELFQKIELNEDGSLRPEDADKVQHDSEENSAQKDLDEEVIESLLRGNDVEETTEDSYTLEEMFSLETREKGKKPSSP